MSWNIYADADEVREKLKVAKETLPGLAEIEMAERYFNELVDSYESKISELEGDISNKDDEIDGLQAQLDEYDTPGELEESAAAILTYYTGHEPSLGEVTSLKDDIMKLLVEKYNVSSGEI